VTALIRTGSPTTAALYAARSDDIPARKHTDRRRLVALVAALAFVDEAGAA
jgi:hypothetical protein